MIYMIKDCKTSDRAVASFVIARYLERICDHSTNIAEDAIYMVEAKVVKHHKETGIIRFFPEITEIYSNAGPGL